MKKTICLFLGLIIVALCVGCGEPNIINEKELASLVGDYQVTGLEDNYWHLYIGDDEPCLSVYDNAAGNPGVEGEIISCNAGNIVVKIDPDYYEQLPSYDWKCDGKTLTVHIAKTDDGVVLTNNGVELTFVKEAEIDYDLDVGLDSELETE